MLGAAVFPEGDLQGLQSAGPKSGLGQDRQHVPGIKLAILALMAHKTPLGTKLHPRCCGLSGDETRQIPAAQWRGTSPTSSKKRRNLAWEWSPQGRSQPVWAHSWRVAQALDFPFKIFTSTADPRGWAAPPDCDRFSYGSRITQQTSHQPPWRQSSSGKRPPTSGR